VAQPANLVKLDMVFTLGDDAGVEDSAEFGVWGQFNFTPASSADWDTALGELAQFSADTFSSVVPTTHFSSGAGLLHARAARCDAAGHTLNEAIKTPADPWTGSGSSNSLPWAVSLVVSLYTYTPGTFIAFAGRRRGRVYLPPLNAAILTDGKSGEISITLAQTLRDNFKTWLLGVKAHALAESEQVWTPGVLSTTGNMWNAVTDLRVDNKLDTQRRRERQQPAVVSSTAFS